MTPAESVDAQALTASIATPSSDTTITSGQAIAFQGTLSGGSGVVTCHWSFGQGIPDSEQHEPEAVSFATPGKYTVSFTAEDDSGASIVDSVIVTVVPLMARQWLRSLSQLQIRLLLPDKRSASRVP